MLWRAKLVSNLHAIREALEFRLFCLLLMYRLFITLDLRDMIREKGYCTLDIIRTLSEILLGYDLPPLIFSHLIERLAYLEYLFFFDLF